MGCPPGIPCSQERRSARSSGCWRPDGCGICSLTPARGIQHGRGGQGMKGQRRSEVSSSTPLPQEPRPGGWVERLSCVPRPRQRSSQCLIEGGWSGGALWPLAIHRSDQESDGRGAHSLPGSARKSAHLPHARRRGELGWGRGSTAAGHVASQECAGARAGRGQGTGRNAGQWAPG